MQPGHPFSFKLQLVNNSLSHCFSMVSEVPPVSPILKTFPIVMRSPAQTVQKDTRNHEDIRNFRSGLSEFIVLYIWIYQLGHQCKRFSSPKRWKGQYCSLRSGEFKRPQFDQYCHRNGIFFTLLAMEASTGVKEHSKSFAGKVGKSLC